MPLKPIDYSKAIQYKIVCNNPAITDCYNGSTCSLKDRKSKHKKHCTNPNDKYYHLKVYQFIRENGGWDNWTFIQLEEYPCKSKQELLARERYWFDIIKPTMNSNLPMLTTEERKESNRQHTKEYNATHKEERKKWYAEYNATHREELKKRDAEYYATHIEERKKYNAEYAATHREERKKRNAEYYATHREENLAKITCECGCIITKHALSRHQRTQKHLNLLAQNQ